MFPHVRVGRVGFQGTARNGRGAGSWALAVVIAAAICPALHGQAYLQIRINEIIANNNTVGPTNCLCQNVDMVEIYNPTAGQINLHEKPVGGAERMMKLSDKIGPDGKPVPLFKFSSGHKINPGSRFVIFCDSAVCEEEEGCDIDPADARDEAHAPFALDRDGETVFLLGFDDEVVDVISFPPLSGDVSYGRCPDGSDTWVFNSRPTVSFGTCSRPPAIAGISCPGARNETAPGVCGSNVAPQVDLEDYSTFIPASGEPVRLRARVIDEKVPDGADISRVEIVYRLDAGTTLERSAMSLVSLEVNDVNPLDRWSIWEGEIPGQVEGTVVDFYLEVADLQGATGTSPERICPWPSGPCLPGQDGNLPPGCPAECQVPYQLMVSERYQGPLVLNEVVPENQSIVRDESETACLDRTTNCLYDDYLELYNRSGEAQVLTGLVLSSRPFFPGQGWAFPLGLLGERSMIQPGQHLLVWVDGDGGQPPPPPDPNDPAAQRFHTNFTIDGRSDELILFQPVQRGQRTVYRPLDGLRWGHEGEPVDERDIFIPRGVEWRYFKGTANPPVLPDPQNASLQLSWLQVRYSDDTWSRGPTPIGYGITGLGTSLTDMRSSYRTVFLRRRFTIPNSLFETLEGDAYRLLAKRLYLEVFYDDGFLASINGEPVASRNLARPGFDVPASEEIAPTTRLFDITELKDQLDADGQPLLKRGQETNVLTVEVHNASLDSQDLVFDARLFWGVEGLGDDGSLGRIPDGFIQSPLIQVSGDLATPRAANRAPSIRFRRGDAGAPPDGGVDISDAISILGYLFLGSGEPSCLDAADTDNSGGLELTDAIYLLSFLFQGGPLPPPPGPFTCGPDEGPPDEIPACVDPTCA